MSVCSVYCLYLAKEAKETLRFTKFGSMEDIGCFNQNSRYVRGCCFLSTFSATFSSLSLLCLCSLLLRAHKIKKYLAYSSSFFL